MSRKDPTELSEKLFALMFLIQDHMKSALKNAEKYVSPVQALILRALCDEGAMSQVAIAKKLGRDKSQIAKLVRELEDMGLVDREASKIDRRSFVVSVRPEVVRTVEKITRKEKVVVKKMLEGVSPEQRALLSSLFDQMSGNLSRPQAKEMPSKTTS